MLHFLVKMKAFNSLIDVEYCPATLFFLLKDVPYYVVHDVYIIF